MTLNGWLQIFVFYLVVLALTRPLGTYMARVYEGERTWFDSIFRTVERLLYKICGIDSAHEMKWTEYSFAMLLFSAASMLVLYLIERLQGILPLNPQGLPSVEAILSFNTAASFTTNTNWQAYVPEATMSYLTQMAGLAYHNFASAAVGMALAVAFIRGIARKEAGTLGNFWVDMTRSILWVLLPGSVVLALVFVSQGVVQNFRPYDKAALVQPQQTPRTDASGKPIFDGNSRPVMGAVTTQTIAQGPVASQEAIKMLGTNGGGFFNANSAHPFENPTPFTNFLQMVAIFAIPAALTSTLGSMVKAPRHGWAIFAAMSVLFFAGVTVTYWSESRGNPLLPTIERTASASPSLMHQPGGNMEGKEVRFGVANSALFATVTTDASCGAVNSMHDSFLPLGGLVPLTNILLGEIVFGGVGSGLYGMLVFVVLCVFIAGLMVGRTPEYLGKKIEAYDVQMGMLYILIFPLIVLVLTAVSVLEPSGLAAIANNGPHGLSEILYSFTSSTGNNGSAFAGVSVNTSWYNLLLGAAMLIGRFLMIVPMLALAGNLAQKKIVPPSPGTFPVTTPLFTVLLVGVILIVGALTFFPALSLGPILEHLLMQAGKTF